MIITKHVAYLLSPAHSRVPGIQQAFNKSVKTDELGPYVDIRKQSALLLLSLMLFINDKMNYKAGKHTIKALNFFQNILLPFSTCPRSWEVGAKR